MRVIPSRDAAIWAACLLRRRDHARRDWFHEQRSRFGALRRPVGAPRRWARGELDRAGVVGLLGQPRLVPRTPGRCVPATDLAWPTGRPRRAGGLRGGHRRRPGGAPPHGAPGGGPDVARRRARGAHPASVDAARLDLPHPRESRVPDARRPARGARGRRPRTPIVAMDLGRAGGSGRRAAREGRVRARADDGPGLVDSPQPEAADWLGAPADCRDNYSACSPWPSSPSPTTRSTFASPARRSGDRTGRVNWRHSRSPRRWTARRRSSAIWASTRVRLLWHPAPWSLALLAAAWTNRRRLAHGWRAWTAGERRGLVFATVAALTIVLVLVPASRFAERYIFAANYLVATAGILVALRQWPGLAQTVARWDRSVPALPALVWLILMAARLIVGPFLPRISG